MKSQSSNFKSQKCISKVKTFEFLLVILTFSFYILHLIGTGSALASEASKNVSPSASIREKLKILQAEIASKAAKLKNEIGKKLTNRAYVGTIQAISDTTITLATQKGVKIVSISDSTEFRGWKKPNINSLTNDDFIVALGDIDDTEGLTAKRIVKSSGVDFEQKQVIWGRLLSASQSLLSIRANQDQVYNLTIAPDTVFRPNNLTPFNQPIIVVAVKTKDNTLKGRFIYVPNLLAHSATASSTVKKDASPSSKKATSSAFKKTSPAP